MWRRTSLPQICYGAGMVRQPEFAPTLTVGLLLLFLGCGPSRGDASDFGTSGTSGGDTQGMPVTTAIPTEVTSGGSSALASEGGAAGTSAGGVFVLPPDGGCGAMAGCDLWAQDCAAGSKCVAAAVCAGGDAKNSTICVPVAGQPVGTGGACVVEGDPLSGVDNCAPGSICWGLDADNVGICVAQCVGTPDAPACAGVGESCFIRDSDVEMICLEGCEPLAPGCGSGEVCVVFELDFFCLKTAGAAALHESCSFMKTCAAGLLCVASAGIAGCDQDAPGCCEGLCDRTVEPDPDVQCPGQACIPFAGGAFDDVGLCGPPP